MGLLSWIKGRRATKSAEGTPANPSPWLVDYYGGGDSAAGVPVTEQTIMSASSVFACVRNISEDCAKLPYVTYRRLQPQGKERLYSHPLYRLLHDDPNPEMTAFDFRQAVTACAVLYGKGFAEIERTNAGVPLYLWPIAPWRVMPRRRPNKQLYYEVDNGKAQLELKDVVCIKGFSTDGILGCMVARMGKDALGLVLAAQKFAAKFFGSGSRPSGVLQTDKKLDEEGAKRLKAAWESTHGGVENMHKTAVLEDGMTFEPMGVPPEEAQLLETRQFHVEDVARWFRMPPHKIQQLLRATFSNIEHQSIEYVTDTLMPWLVRWEQETKKKLVSESESDIFAEHLVDALLRGDTLSRSQALEIQFRNGEINLDEWRAIENRNPLPEGIGQTHFVPMNYTTIENAIAGKNLKGGGSSAGNDNGNGNDNINPADGKKPVDDAADDGGDETNAVEAGELRKKVLASHRPALVDAAARVIRREVEVIRRKAKTPATLREGTEKFYAEHGDYVRTCLLPTLKALHGTICGLDPKATDQAEQVVREFANRHVAAATGELAKAADVEALLESWEDGKPFAIADELLKCEVAQ
jgi:HK97 family phage portal protein